MKKNGNAKSKTLIPIVLVGFGLLIIVVGLVSRQPVSQAQQTADTPNIFEDQEEAVVAHNDRPTTGHFVPGCSLSVALSGEYGNGGVWRWEEISNLMSQYTSSNDLITVTHNGESYQGVPLPYLLHFSEINNYAEKILIKGKEYNLYAYPVANLMNCTDCVVTATEESVLAVILPGFEPSFINNLERLDAFTDEHISELDDAENARLLQ